MKTMQVFLNKQARTFSTTMTVAELLLQEKFQAPFAVAINTNFIPKNMHATTTLHEGDQIEVISPVTGG